MEKYDSDEVEKTLASLDGIEPLKASPYFYTRLMARKEAAEFPAFRLKWGLASLCVITIFNVFTYFNLVGNESESDLDTMGQLASEYNMKWTSIYLNEFAE